MKNLLLFSRLLAGLLMFAPVIYAAESDVDGLLNLLTEKKILTAEEAAEFRANSAIKKQEEKETQKEFLVIAGKPIKISGYIQPRYRYEDSIYNTFDIRRARLDIRGDLTERWDYRTQIEFGGDKGPFLLDAIAGFKVDSYLKLSAGQQKIPFSMENLTSSPKLETINRSQVAEALVARSKDVIGNQNGRDIGLQAGGDLFSIGDRRLLDYAAGIFNGAGINRLDNNDRKDYIGRLVFHPVKGLDIGSSYYNGYGKWNLNPKDTNSVPTSQKRNRLGFEAAYSYENLTLKGEYIYGQDGAIDKDGWYVQGGYFIIPKILQAVLKYDIFDPDKDKGKNNSTVYTFGANGYFNKWAFLQVNYELKDQQGQKNNNAVTAQLTLQF